MSQKLIVFIFILLFTFPVFAQEIEYERIIESDTIFFETTNSHLLKCSDGNYIITGRTRESLYNSKCNIQTVKFTPSGEILWQNSYKHDDYVFVRNITEKNGNYNIFSSADPGGRYLYKLMLLSYDVNGNLIFDKIDEDIDNKYASLNSISEMNGKVFGTNYGKLIGNKIMRRWIIFDENLNYEKTVEIDTLEFDNDIFQYGEIMQKLDEDLYCYTSSVIISNKNGNRSPIYYDFYDKSGKKTNQIKLNTDSISFHSGTGAVFKADNGDIILSGKIRNAGVPRIHFIKRYDTNNNLIWEKQYFDQDLYFSKIVEDDNRNLIIIGSNVNTDDLFDFCVIILDSEGNETHKKIWTIDSLSCRLFDAVQVDDGSIIVAGTVSNQIYFAEISYNPTSVSLKSVDKNLIINNPVNDILYLNETEEISAGRVSIYNSLGDLITNKEYTDQIDLSSLAPGLYFLHVGDVIESFIKN